MTNFADQRVDVVFQALADPTRRKLLRHLSERPATVTELSAHVSITRQAVAKHIAALHDAGLVEGERSGREVRYRLTQAPMMDVAGWMVDVGAAWDRRLATLRNRFRRRVQDRPLGSR
jgi:DNA-binding transcriptional ArsR family regulator